MRKKEKRESPRKKCRKIANLVYEGNTEGDEQYMVINMLDESETGMCVASSQPIDVSQMITISVDSEASYPAEFVWTQQKNKKYLIGLKKV